MNKEYDAITAFHYAKYRPALHTDILGKRIGVQSFTSGLDIGCGTGQSTLALANFCSSVVGIDPSVEMLSKGIAHPKVSYGFFDKNRIDFEDHTFDIITLAGSLWYAKSQELINEIVRVSLKNATVLVYDFEVLLKDILAEIGFEPKSEGSNSYNHQEDFSGLVLECTKMIEKGSDKVQFQVSSNNLAHLILSVKEQYAFLERHYASADLYNRVVAELNLISEMKPFSIEANTFFTSYRIL